MRGPALGLGNLETNKMHEMKKLAEAKYFYNKIKDELENTNSFKYYLSAFLGASRSVLQYAGEEAKSKKNQAWYDGCISKSSLFKFFKDKRDINIHAKPLETIKQVKVIIKEIINLSDSINVIKRDKDEYIYEVSFSKQESKPKIQEPQPSLEYKYIFDDWPGGEDIVELGGKYLIELENLIKDGIGKGYITG